jgi:hypothetical protein
MVDWREKWLKRISKNTMTSECEYEDKRGNIHKEVVYMKRSLMPVFGEWKRIHPPFYLDEYGEPIIKDNGKIKIHWINFIFGGWKNFWTLVFVLTIAGMVLLQFRTDFAQIEYLRNIPCVQQYLNKSIIDISNFTIN